jgi:threonine 3-dehydrogenase
LISLLGLEAGEVTLDLSSQVVMRGITGRRQFETWDQTSAYLTSGRVDVGPILTHRVSLRDFQHAGEGGGVLYPLDGGRK